jgi:hypothetical protein
MAVLGSATSNCTAWEPAAHTSVMTLQVPGGRLRLATILSPVRKGYQGRRPRTWLRLTTRGTKALDQELAALRALVTRLDYTQPPRQAHPTQT